MTKEEKINAYKVVFDDLQKFDMFRGRYDAKNGSEQFMHGVSAVMEVIAGNISEEVYDQFVEEFLQNMTDCENKVQEEEDRFVCDACVNHKKSICKDCSGFDHFVRKSVVKRKKNKNAR